MQPYTALLGTARLFILGNAAYTFLIWITFNYVDLDASLHNFFPYATCIKTPIRIKLSSPCETIWTGPHCLKGMVIGLAHFYLGKQALYGSYN